MKDNKPKLSPAPEIMGAIGIQKLSTTQLAELKTDTKDFLQAHLDLNLGNEVNLNIVQNSNDEIHIALPFYSDLPPHTTDSLSDDDLEQVSGGEVFVTAIVATVLAIGTVGAIAGGVAAKVLKDQAALEENDGRLERVNAQRAREGKPPISGK